MYVGRIFALVCIASLSTAVVAEEKWNFNLSPYIWFAGLEGDVSPLKRVPVSAVNVSPSEALADTEASFMVIFEAKKGKNGIYTDTFYSDAETKEASSGPAGSQLTSRTKTTMLTVAYSRNVLNENGSSIDLLAGGRWWSIDADINISSLLPSLNVAGDNSESWVDPFIGVKGKLPISDSKFFVSGALAYGGFDINADSFYEINANVGYQWSDTLSAAMGYRLYDLDYDQNDFQYDVEQAGWVIGMTWGF